MRKGIGILGLTMGLLAGLSGQASAAQLSTDVGIASVEVSWYFNYLIVVTLDGTGSGDCSSAGSTVTFSTANFSNFPDNFDRTLTLLLSAQMAGKKVSIRGGTANDCTSAHTVTVKS